MIFVDYQVPSGYHFGFSFLIAFNFYSKDWFKEKKEEIWLSPMVKAHIPSEKNQETL